MIALALTCVVQEVYLGVALEQPHTERIIILGNGATAEGVLAGLRGLRPEFRRDGSIKIRGGKTKLGFDTWAELTRAGDGYNLEWDMNGETRRDGTYVVTTWKQGSCIPGRATES